MQKSFNLFETHGFKESYTTKEVAKNYGIQERTARAHKDLHSDELIENIHYFYSTEKTNGGTQRVIRWTLEGVYMLGFFIKSNKAKIYRKKVAEFLRICKEREYAKIEALRKDYLAIADRNANLEAIAISKAKHHQSVVNGYKSQLSQQKSKYENQIKTIKGEQKKKFSRAFVSRDEFNTRIINTCHALESIKKALEKTKSYAFYGGDITL